MNDMLYIICLIIYIIYNYYYYCYTYAYLLYGCFNMSILLVK